MKQTNEHDFFLVQTKEELEEILRKNTKKTPILIMAEVGSGIISNLLALKLKQKFELLESHREEDRQKILSYNSESKQLLIMLHSITEKANIEKPFEHRIMNKLLLIKYKPIRGVINGRS